MPGFPNVEDFYCLKKVETGVNYADFGIKKEVKFF